MKRCLMIIILSLNLGIMFAQTHRYYCEIIGRDETMSNGMKVIFDLGTSYTYDIWGDISDKLMFVDENGKTIEFKSMMEAMNYMSDRGWLFQKTYSTHSHNFEFRHFLLYKDANTQEEAKKGIMTKEEWKELHK